MDDDESASASASEPQRKRRLPAAAAASDNSWQGARSASPHHRVPSRNHSHTHNQDYARTAGLAGFEHHLPSVPGLNGGVFLGAGAPSSYMRSGSNAPTRTHSPLNPGGSVGGGGGAYHSTTGGGGYFNVNHGGASPPGSDMSSLLLAAGAALSAVGIPTLGELQQHYAQLEEQRRVLEGMMEKTERLMVGVKRGIDEMRGVGVGGEEGEKSPKVSSVVGSPASPSSNGASSVPLARAAGGERASIWPVVESAAAAPAAAV